MVGADQIEVNVIYALPSDQRLLPVVLSCGATIEQVIQLSGILKRYPDITLDKCQVGVFGRIRGLQDRVADGDRIEIYRPLAVDPKESRRRRAKSG